MMLKIVSIILTAALSLISPVYAETFKLKNGGTISGQLIEKTDQYLKLNVEDVVVTYFMDELDLEGDVSTTAKSSNDEIMVSVMATSEFNRAMAGSIEQLIADLTAGNNVESSIGDFKERTSVQRKKLETVKFVKGLEIARRKIIESSDFSDALAEAALKNDDASLQQNMFSIKQALADAIAEIVAFCKREDVPEEQLAKIIVALMQKD